MMKKSYQKTERMLNETALYFFCQVFNKKILMIRFLAETLLFGFLSCIANKTSKFFQDHFQNDPQFVQSLNQ